MILSMRSEWGGSEHSPTDTGGAEGWARERSKRANAYGAKHAGGGTWWWKGLGLRTQHAGRVKRLGYGGGTVKVDGMGNAVRDAVKGVCSNLHCKREERRGEGEEGGAEGVEREQGRRNSVRIKTDL